MNIDDLKDVVVNPNSYKFIVCRVKNKTGDTKIVVRAGRGFHFEILQRLQKEVCDSDLKVNCIGGGSIYIDNQEKTIYINGYSGNFGREPDRLETAQMLKVVFPEFEIVVQ